MRHVPPPFALGQPTLSRGPACSGEERPHRELPESRKLAGQPLGGVVSALEPAVRVARDERDTCRVRLRQRLADDGRRPSGQPAQPALFPGGHHRAEPVVVRHGRPSTGEREPPPRTFRAALHGPGGRRPATLAERRLDAAERRSAALAHLRSGEEAEKAALRQEQVEHVVTLGKLV
jgi:hypothetical protein